MRRGPLIPTGVSLGIRKYSDSKVVDLSEWGRPLGRAGARFLNEKPVTVLQVTHLHLLLILKGIIDAVDGELARL